MLELLLVAPLNLRLLIWGRLTSLWFQFLPAAAGLLGIWSYLAAVLPPGHSTAHSGPQLWTWVAPWVPQTPEAQAILFFASSFLALPAIGLYLSLRCRTVLAGFLATLATGLLVPCLLAGASAWLWADYASYAGMPHPLLLCLDSSLAQALLALLALLGLVFRLRTRRFPLGRVDR